MLNESIAPVEITKEVEKTPENDLRDYLKSWVSGCAGQITKERSVDMGHWGATLISAVTERIDKLRTSMGDRLDLDNFLTFAMDQVRKIDKSNPARIELENELTIVWAGLVGELAVYDILGELNKEKKLTLFEGGDSEVMEKFDRYGADFVIIREDETIVGLQVKKHGGRSISVFNTLTAGSDLKTEVDELMELGFVDPKRNIINSDRSFRTEARNFFGEDAKAILMYTLVGKMNIDRKKGQFVGGGEERQRIKESLLNVINGTESKSKIFDDRTKS